LIFGFITAPFSPEVFFTRRRERLVVQNESKQTPLSRFDCAFVNSRTAVALTEATEDTEDLRGVL
jgi:hypothetical protein